MQDIVQGLCSVTGILAPDLEPPHPRALSDPFPRHMESCAAAPCSSTQLAWHQKLSTPRPFHMSEAGPPVMDGQQSGLCYKGVCHMHRPDAMWSCLISAEPDHFPPECRTPESA